MHELMDSVDFGTVCSIYMFVNYSVKIFSVVKESRNFKTIRVQWVPA